MINTFVYIYSSIGIDDRLKLDDRIPIAHDHFADPFRNRLQFACICE